ncbi:MAG: DUF488 domain-containing protein [Candidatus Dormibacteria bacterium]
MDIPRRPGAGGGTGRESGAPDPTAPGWFAEATTCAAGNQVSFATGTSEEHEALQRLAEGWVLWRWSDVAGHDAARRAVDRATARIWLLRNEHFDTGEELTAGWGTMAGAEDSRSAARARAPQVARVYAPRSADQGLRVLVDRLWPRGISHASDLFDVWMKDVAPSSALRRWYRHQPALLAEFRARYLEELERGPGLGALEELAQRVGETAVTLVTATSDLSLSAAAVLADAVSAKLGPADRLRPSEGPHLTLSEQEVRA